MKCRRGLFALALIGMLSRAAVGQVPKYGPRAERLHARHEYLQRNAAHDFWRLMPYYLPQPTDAACSAASVAMLVNALRAEQELGSQDELATPTGLVERVGDQAWAAAVANGGAGVTLDELAKIVKRALAAYDVSGRAVEQVHVADTSDATLAQVRKVLAANEADPNDVLLVQFQQSTFTGDPEGAVGHIAPVAAYDAASDRALILDPDRRWYEPYWVTIPTLVEGMATRDPVNGQSRGYLWVRGNDERRRVNPASD